MAPHRGSSASVAAGLPRPIVASIFDDPALDFRGNRAEGDDILGDAYEYLMRHFAAESGKSKGQFYTPAEVSRMMAKVIGAGSATREIQSSVNSLGPCMRYQ
jgi:type I restriction-modification system DNA methylase subunit